MRVQAEHWTHASLFRGVRQFSARATSSANSFFPTPSSPANSNAPGSRPVSSIRFNTSLTRAFPAIWSNMRLLDSGSTAQKREDHVLHARLRLLHWTTGVDHFHS